MSTKSFEFIHNQLEFIHKLSHNRLPMDGWLLTYQDVFIGIGYVGR